MPGALSNERTGLSFTVAAVPCRCIHSWVPYSRDSWPYFTVSDSRFPQPGGQGSRIYVIQEQCGPVILPGNVLLFRRLLRFDGLRWRSLNLPPRGCWLIMQAKVKVTLQLTISQSWCRAPCGAHDQIFITAWQLRACFCGAPTLTRGWVWLLYMIMSLASAIFLGSESLGTKNSPQANYTDRATAACRRS
jgi:hypothetical protein